MSEENAMAKMVGGSGLLVLVLSLLVFAAHSAAQDKPLKKISFA